MRYLLALTILLGSTPAAVSQGAGWVRLGPTWVRVCELQICACASVPGEVDSCARYWDYKTDYTRGGFIRFPNEDPSACASAVEDNLAELAGYYGKRPEASVPNQEMIARVEALAVPLIEPLYDKEGLDHADADDAHKALTERISASFRRVLSLSEEVRNFGAIAEANTAWEGATLAAVTLVAKADAIGNAISLARQWPTIAEFAPLVWELKVCKHVKPDLVAELDRRIDQNSIDSTHSFAFYGDWLKFVGPFNLRFPPAGSDLWKSEQFRSLADPFFIEPEDIVGERKQKTLFTAADIRKFKEAIAHKNIELAAYVADRTAQQAVRLPFIRSAFSDERNTVENLHAALRAERDTVVGLNVEVEKANRRVADVAAEIKKMTSDIATGDDTLHLRINERNQARSHDESARVDVSEKRNGVTRAQQTLDAITLNCDGATYQDCEDGAAKLEYDHQLYDANYVLAAARQSYYQALDRSVLSTDQLLSAEQAIYSQQEAVAEMREELSALVEKHDQVTAALRRATVEAEKKEAETAPLVNTMADLDEAAAKLAGSVP